MVVKGTAFNTSVTLAAELVLLHHPWLVIFSNVDPCSFCEFILVVISRILRQCFYGFSFFLFVYSIVKKKKNQKLLNQSLIHVPKLDW